MYIWCCSCICPLYSWSVISYTSVCLKCFLHNCVNSDVYEWILMLVVWLHVQCSANDVPHWKGAAMNCTFNKFFTHNLPLSPLSKPLTPPVSKKLNQRMAWEHSWSFKVLAPSLDLSQAAPTSSLQNWTQEWPGNKGSLLDHSQTKIS